MLRTAAKGIMPSANIVGAQLLNEAVEKVKAKNSKMLKNKNVGLGHTWVSAKLDVMIKSAKFAHHIVKMAGDHSQKTASMAYVSM